jgi:hypothetical protein
MGLDSAKKMTIKSMEHYNTMIKDGFEVKQVRIYGNPQHLNTAIVLAKGDQNEVGFLRLPLPLRFSSWVSSEVSF